MDESGTSAQRDATTGDAPTDGGALALVYQGPGACDGCAEALAHLLGRAGFRTRTVGPADLTRDATFTGAALYAQPGGDNTMELYAAVGAAAWPGVAERLRAYVRGGGRYLGVCLGGFLAGEWMDDAATIRALGLLQGDVGYFENTPEDPTVDQVLPITWLLPSPIQRSVYFQEGPYFDAAGTVYARFSDGRTAALLARYGEGKVAVSGIHFEAEDAWYTANDLSDADGVDWVLGEQLIHDLME